MKEYWVKIKEWHGQLEQRERNAVNIGGAALVFAILYLGIWSPFLGRVDDLRARMGNEQKTLAWMQNADRKISQMAGGGSERQKITPVAMLAVLQAQVQKAGMKESMSELKQGANDTIQMQFKNVSFDQLMKLLMSVIKANHVSISEFSSTAEATPGMVNAEVTLALG